MRNCYVLLFDPHERQIEKVFLSLENLEKFLKDDIENKYRDYCLTFNEKQREKGKSHHYNELYFYPEDDFGNRLPFEKPLNKESYILIESKNSGFFYEEFELED
jgi:hypothetical protein